MWCCAGSLRDLLNICIAAACLGRGDAVPFPAPVSKARAVLQALSAEDGTSDDERVLCCSAAAQVQRLRNPVPCTLHAKAAVALT